MHSQQQVKIQNNQKTYPKKEPLASHMNLSKEKHTVCKKHKKVQLMNECLPKNQRDRLCSVCFDLISIDV